MNFRRACHKLRMFQRRQDQKNRKSGYFITSKDKQNYEEYHKQQRQQLATAIKQLTLEPQT